jgi:hypothetical protein
MMRMTLLCGALSTLALASPALAQDAEEPPICTDRPTKANATCTVPAGKVQLETTAVGWGRIESGGAKTDVWQVGSSFLKLGLTDRSDLEVGFTPYFDIKTKAEGASSHTSGIGDVTVRYKHRLTADGSSVQVGLIPFVKLPTAKLGIGNDKVEGGLAVPISIATGSPVTVVLGPELDLLSDSDGDGRHVALVNLVNVSGPIAPGLTLIGELWTATNFDPADTVTLVSVDAAVAYLVNNNFQLDLGANLGLNHNTPDIELYAGFAIRF